MKLATTILVAALFLASCPVHADIPQFMSYQGVLRDAVGNPVPDGTYDVEFNLYDVATGGTTLWTEPHTLTATGGIIEAQLGSITPLSGLSFEVPYWLGVSVEGEAELTPRTPLATVPYAGRAGSAESCDEVDDHDWETVGDDIYRGSGNVGIGILPPVAKLHVVTGSEPCVRFEGGGSGTDFNLSSRNSAGTAGAFFSNTGTTGYPGLPCAVFGYGGPGSRGAHFVSEGSDGLASYSPNGKAIYGHSDGNYAGYFEGGGWGVYVDDLLETNAFRMQPGAANGYVLTSNSGGDASWQPITAGADGDWTIDGNHMHSAVSGHVGIGVTTADPVARLDVYHDTGARTLNVMHGGSSPGQVVNIERTTPHGNANDLLQLRIPSGSSDTSQFIEAENGGSNVFLVHGDGLVETYGGVEASTDSEVTGRFTSSLVSDATTAVYANISEVGTGQDPMAYYGWSVPALDYGFGGKFYGGNTGVYGEALSGESILSSFGVEGRATGGSSGYNYGVYGYASGGWGARGVYGYAPTTDGYAGYFVGHADVSGTFTAGTKSFKIDHPLDPENKYLMHSCVESDEMMNIYNGIVVLDAGGEARVEMPDWFEALNQTFRYQLTAIGAPGPNLYISEKLSGNAFSIAGGEPGMEVSWQVTGVRHDPLAVANRVAVEVDKPAHEAGKYKHPEAYGMPATSGIDYVEPKEQGREPRPIEHAPLPAANRSDDG